MLLYEAIQKFSEYYKFNVQKNTTNSYSFILRSFCLYLRNPKLEDVTLDHILEWFQMMDSLGWDSNSLSPKAVVLRRFFGYFRDLGHSVLQANLIPIPKGQKKFPRVADEEKYHRLLEIIPKKDPIHIRNRTLIELYHDSGARNSEILSLDIKDLNLIQKRAIIHTEKAKKLPYREIFWDDETNADLKKWLALRRKFVDEDNGVLFINLSKNHLGERLGNRGVVKMLEEYSAKAGMETLNAHSLRHLYGRKLAKKGANNSSISSLMGHSDIQSSQVYTHLYGDDLKEVWEKFR